MLDVIYKDRDAVAVLKPAGMPSQPDKSADTDVMSALSAQLSEEGDNSTLYLIHRLDRVVGGILVFARNKNSAARLSAEAAGEGMDKEYLAVIDGYLEPGTLVDMLYKDARVGKAFVVKDARKDAKRAELTLDVIDRADTKTLVKIKLKTGRFHQIRAQLSSRGTPICADGKYGSRDRGAALPALFAYSLAFDSRDGRVSVKRLPDTDEYPWCIFDKECWKDI
ncbi:MAG: RNA pseudouridine synthase [Clostridia bacterium]|nr:RNA pseudouridine synthase [Clostridia bacterium]